MANMEPKCTSIFRECTESTWTKQHWNQEQQSISSQKTHLCWGFTTSSTGLVSFPRIL